MSVKQRADAELRALPLEAPTSSPSRDRSLPTSHASRHFVPFGVSSI